MHKCYVRADQGAVRAWVVEIWLRLEGQRLQRDSPGAEDIKNQVCGGSKTRELLATLRKCLHPGLTGAVAGNGEPWGGRGTPLKSTLRSLAYSQGWGKAWMILHKGSMWSHLSMNDTSGRWIWGSRWQVARSLGDVQQFGRVCGWLWLSSGHEDADLGAEVFKGQQTFWCGSKDRDRFSGSNVSTGRGGDSIH